MEEKRMSWDGFLLGLGLGLFTPFFFFFCYWLFVHSYMGFIPDFFKYLSIGKVMGPVISLCVFPNLGLFFLFINRYHIKSGKGIILATFLYAGLILYVRLVIENTGI